LILFAAVRAVGDLPAFKGPDDFDGYAYDAQVRVCLMQHARQKNRARLVSHPSHHAAFCPPPVQARYLADQYGSFAVRNGTLQQARRR
jgi:hypothetical protein